MALIEIMQQIEGYRFSSELNLVAGTKAFRRALREHELVGSLRELAAEAAIQQEIVKRLTDLAKAEIDARYENRHDTALCAYLTVLGDTADPGVVAKAASTATAAPNCWWVVSLAREKLMQAVATGHAEILLNARTAVSPTIADPISHTSSGARIRQWFQEKPDSPNSTTVQLILTDLRATQAKAQIPTFVGEIGNETSTDESRPATWRGRKRQRRLRPRGVQSAESLHTRGGRQAVPMQRG